MNIDETGWRLKGAQRALWGAFTDRHAVLAITDSRHEDHAREILADSRAVITSDRWWAYNHLPLGRRQICWSHLQRDFQAQAEGIGAEKAFGDRTLELCDELFWSWEIYQHTRDRAELTRRIRAVRRDLKPLLRVARLRRQSAALQAHPRAGEESAQALAGPVDVHHQQRLTPTNNHAERGLRGAVIYRKLSLGSQSDRGETRTARLLSAHTTCRLQGRSLFEYVADALDHHARGAPVPLLA